MSCVCVTHCSNSVLNNHLSEHLHEIHIHGLVACQNEGGERIALHALYDLRVHHEMHFHEISTITSYRNNDSTV